MATADEEFVDYDDNEEEQVETKVVEADKETKK
jgi:hypothetical protein